MKKIVLWDVTPWSQNFTDVPEEETALIFSGYAS
jgi:hypothetical protein